MKEFDEESIKKLYNMPPIRRSSSKWQQYLPPREPKHKTLPVRENKISTSTDIPVFNVLYPVKKFDKRSNNFKHDKLVDSFHNAIGPMLLLGQCFGLMPVSGITDPDHSGLEFLWTNKRTFYGFVTIIGSGMFFLLSVIRACLTGVNLGIMGGLVFYGSTFMTMLVFLKLAPRWPAVAALVAENEKPRVLVSGQRNISSLRNRFRLCCFIVLFTALVEHLLCIIASIAAATDCHGEHSIVEEHFLNAFSQYFYFINFTIMRALILEFFNIAATFNWNFMDLFIIIISLGLTDRFDQLNERLNKFKGQSLPQQFWQAAREEYAQLARMVRKIDHELNLLIMLSFATNLYIICQQLYNIFRVNDKVDETVLKCGEDKSKSILWGMANTVYFAFSFIFLMCRAMAVCLGAARLHSATLRPLAALFAAPSASYCDEIGRFIDHVSTDTIAFTGLNFFHITRGLILTITGTIITYELVLVQFTEGDPKVFANISVNDKCEIIVDFK